VCKHLIALHQRYLIKFIAQNQYHIDTTILQFLIENFSIKHSYFSSPITCPTSITTYNSNNQRDQIFGSQGQAFQHRWKGIGIAHPPNNNEAQQAIQWARLATQEHEENITIIILSDENWYKNDTSHAPLHLDTHVIAYLLPDILIYEMLLKPLEKYTEALGTYILCIHHINREFPYQEFKTRF
jgi:hypothetical protein